MIKFVNFEFIFAIIGPILGRVDIKENSKLIKHKIGAFFLLPAPIRGRARRSVFGSCKVNGRFTLKYCSQTLAVCAAS